MKLIPTLASYRGVWNHERFSVAFRQAAQELQTELGAGGDCAMMAVILTGHDIHGMVAGRPEQARAFLENSEIHFAPDSTKAQNNS